MARGGGASDPAIAGEDYVDTSGTLTFEPPNTRLSFSVPLLDDVFREPNGEVFEVVIYSIDGASRHQERVAVVTIRDDDTEIVVDGSASLEGDGPAATLFRIPVRLGAPHRLPITLNYATGDGAAVAGEDYVAASGTLVFAPGETEQTIEIELSGDTTSERNEDFWINFDSAAGALFRAPPGEPPGTATTARFYILDDD